MDSFKAESLLILTFANVNMSHSMGKFFDMHFKQRRKRMHVVKFSLFYLLKDAKQMFEVSFSLTLSVSKIKYVEDERDGRVIGAMVTSLVRMNLPLMIFTTKIYQHCFLL